MSTEVLFTNMIKAILSAVSQHARSHVRRLIPAPRNFRPTRRPTTLKYPLRARRPPYRYRAGTGRSRHVINPAVPQQEESEGEESTAQNAPSSAAFQSLLWEALESQGIDNGVIIGASVEIEPSDSAMDPGAAIQATDPLPPSPGPENTSATEEQNFHTDLGSESWSFTTGSTTFRIPKLPLRLLRAWRRGRIELDIYIDVPLPSD